MEYNRKAHDEVISVVQKFMQDYYQLMARQVRDDDAPTQGHKDNEKHIDRNTNNPDKAS